MGADSDTSGPKGCVSNQESKRQPFIIRLFGLLSKLPLNLIYVLATLLYLVAYYLIRYRKDTVFENIRHAFPNKSSGEVRTIAKRFYKDLADMLVEIIKTPSLSPEEVLEHVEITNPQFFDVFIEQGQPVMLLGTHQANWEWGMLAVSLSLPFPVNAVYKPFHSSMIDDFMLANRSRFGVHMVTPKNALMELMKRRGKMHGVAMLADQSPAKSEEKYWGTLLNQDTAFHLGPEKIIQFTQYPVVFIRRQRVARGYYKITYELLAQPPHPKGQGEIIELYVRRLEELIKEQPSDWLWSHRRWKYKKPLYS